MTKPRYKNTEYFLKVVRVDKGKIVAPIACNRTNSHGYWSSWQPFVYAKSGVWQPEIKGHLYPCSKGYHLCRPNDLRSWFRGKAISSHDLWVVKATTDGMINCGDKVVVHNFRFVKKLTVGEFDEATWRLGYYRGNRGFRKLLSDFGVVVKKNKIVEF